MSDKTADTTTDLGGRSPVPAPSQETQPVVMPGEVRLGRYRLLQRLGEGGMGVVHLALDERGRAVAIKVLRDHIAHDPDARARLAREVSSLRRVDHLLVAPIIDADVDGPRPYLVTRYIPAPSLDAWVRRHGPLRGQSLVRLATGLSEALQAIHAAGVVHRDLKPGNVLLHDDSPVLIDFGIAHIADDTRLTSTGLIMGTPGYLSPELLEGGEVTEATDWWGWAATLAFAAQGKPPFGGGPVDAVVHRVRSGECDLTGVDPKLSPLLAAALHPDASRRPPQPAIVAAVRSYAAGGDTTQALPALDEHPRPGVVTMRLAGGPEAGLGAVGPVGGGQGAGGEPAQTGPLPARSESGPVSAPDDQPPTRVQPIARTSPMPAVAEPPPPPRYARFTAPALFPLGPVPTGAAPDALSRPEPLARSGQASTPAPVTPAPASPAAESTAREPRADPWASPRHGPSDVWQPPTRSGGAVAAHPPRPPSLSGESDRVAYTDPRIGRSQRTGTVLAGIAALAALAATAPVIALFVGVAWGALARLADRTVTSLTLKRFERGRRGGDVPLAVLVSPVRLVVSLLTSVLTLVLPLVVGVAGAFTVALLEGSLGTGGGVTRPMPLAAGAAVVAALAWWGGGGTSLRRGTRSLIRGVAPGRFGAVVVSTLLLLAAAYLAIRTQASQFDVLWWPIREPRLEWNIPWF